MTTPERTFLCPALIGRDVALGFLETRLRSASAGSGHAVLVSGEAGIGKTRLLREFIERARAGGIQVLAGSCFEQDLGVPYGPVIDLLRRVAAEHGTSSSEGVPQELWGLLPERALKRVTIDPERQKRRIFAATARWLAEKAAGQPLLLALEDLHWCDDISLELILHVARGLNRLPLLLLLSYRPDETHPALRHFLATLDRERLATEIELGALPRADVGRCLSAILGAGAQPRQDLVDSLFDLTEGNPFYLEEVVKALVQRGALFYVGGEWRRSPNDLAVPRSVQDVVQQRLASLSGSARAVLAVAAVAGQRFDTSALQHVAGISHEALVEAVRELVAAQLLVEHSDEGFAFRHALTREAIYSTLLGLDRRRLHGAWAAAIERAPAPEARADALAYHWYEAQDWPKAQHFALLAAERARELYSPRAVVTQLTRALEAGRRMGQPPPFAVLRQRGQASETMGEFSSALEDLEAALVAGKASNDPAQEWQALLDIGALWASRDYARAGEFYLRALALAKADGEKGRLARSLNRLGNWHANVGHSDESRECHLEALALFKGLGDAEGEAETQDLLGMGNVIGGNIPEAVEHFRQAIQFFRVQGNQEGLASSLTTIALRAGVYQNDSAPPSGSNSDALADGDEALRITQTIGWRSGEAYALWQSATALGTLGRYSLALETGRRGLAVAEEIGHRQWMSAAHFALGSIYADLFAANEASTHLEQARALGEEVRSQLWTGEASAARIGVLTMEGRLEEARQLVNETVPPDLPMDAIARRALWASAGEWRLASGDPRGALDVAQRLMGTSPHAAHGTVIPRVWLLHGRALTALGAVEEAAESLRAAARGAEDSEQRRLLWRIEAALAQTYAAGHQRDRADEAAVECRKLVLTLSQDVPEGLRGRFLERSLALLPVLGAPTPLQAAKRQSGGLTAREREVAALIAQGKSNRAIGEELVITERTAESHVANIMSKLALGSRAQIAAWAVSHGVTPLS